MTNIERPVSSIGHLCLTRKPGQAMQIGAATVTVTAVRAGSVDVEIREGDHTAALWTRTRDDFGAGGGIVQVIGTRAGSARFRIVAPRTVPVARAE